MSLRHSLCWVFAVASAVTVSAMQRPPVESDQQVLIELEQHWNEAFYQKDVAFIESILADEFIATYDDGSRGDKAKELALATAFDQQVGSVPSSWMTPSSRPACASGCSRAPSRRLSRRCCGISRRASLGRPWRSRTTTR